MKSLVVACALLFVNPVLGAERTITVTGNGVSTATPDVVYVKLGVVTENEQVGKAVSLNKTAMDNVFKAIKKSKVDDKDVCTTNYQLAPKYKYVKDDEARLVGYVVSNEVLVVIRDLDKIGEFLDSLTVDGHANRISSVSFDVLDKEKVLDAARRSAVADALRKAKLITEEAGTKLGSVVSISESSDNTPRYLESARMPSATPIAKGERQFKVTVHLVIALKD